MARTSKAKQQYPLLTKDLPAARKLAGLSQEQSARVLGVSLSALRNWEQGISAPDFGSTGRLLSVFGKHGWTVLRAMGMGNAEIALLCQGFEEALAKSHADKPMGTLADLAGSEGPRDFLAPTTEGNADGDLSSR
ncbi:MAG: helix-turn-helix domain-containing protein [Terriglobia bacterium]